MTDDAILGDLNANWPPSVRTLNGRAVGFKQSEESIQMIFEAVPDFCHSGDIVQGGYITGMLDAAMAYSLIGLPGVCRMVATLEIKVSFISPGHPGALSCKGRVVHRGRSIAYLSAELFQADRLIATATSTVKILQ